MLYSDLTTSETVGHDQRRSCASEFIRFLFFLRFFQFSNVLFLSPVFLIYGLKVCRRGFPEPMLNHILREWFAMALSSLWAPFGLLFVMNLVRPNCLSDPYPTAYLFSFQVVILPSLYLIPFISPSSYPSNPSVYLSSEFRQ